MTAITARLEELSGALIMGLVLLDIFLTVLYARMGSGIINERISGLLWRVFCRVSRPFRRRRGWILSFCGPAILVMMVGCWSLGLALGSALIMHPHLGTSIRNNSGATGTGFLTAIYVAGNSLSIVGGSGYAPQTSAFRLYFLLNSLIGMSVLSLMLTYLMQIYTALLNRNAFGLKVHLATAETRDAAELVAGLGPRGQFQSGYSVLTDMASELIKVKELHHFYPVLLYFRFSQSYYSVSQFSLVTFDVVSLVKSALDDSSYGWLKESLVLSQLWRGAMMLVTTLETELREVQGLKIQTSEQPDAQTLERWRKRYFAALARFRQAGIKTITNEEEGVRAYLALRARWCPALDAFAPAMAYDLSELDAATRAPEAAARREDFSTRLRSAS